jgi:hypothetical protein
MVSRINGDYQSVAQKLFEQAVAPKEKRELKTEEPIFIQLANGTSEQFSSALKEKLNSEKDKLKQTAFEKMIAEIFGAKDSDWKDNHLNIDEVIKRNYVNPTSAEAPSTESPVSNSGVSPQGGQPTGGFASAMDVSNPFSNAFMMPNMGGTSGYVDGQFDMFNPLGGLPDLAMDFGGLVGIPYAPTVNMARAQSAQPRANYTYDPNKRPANWMPRESVLPIVNKIAAKYNISPNLIMAIMTAESSDGKGNRFNSNAKSWAGAMGLMQLMPATARGLGVADPYDPEQSIEGGAKFLSQLHRMFNGDVKLIAAAYNAGPGAVKKYGGVPPYKETVPYANNVSATYNYLSSKQA